jgi:hypothetical protein
MIDPILEKFTTLPEAVARLAAKTADGDIEAARRKLRQSREKFGFPLPDVQSNESADIGSYSKPRKEDVSDWTKRELAILKLRLALQDGALIGFVRDPASGTMFRLEPGDWRGAAFWEDIIRGGVIRSSACESIEPHHGRRVLIEEAALNKWLMRKRDRETRAADKGCLGWLEGKMFASPDRNLRPKRDWFREAEEKFGVSRRAFNGAWKSAILRTGSQWGARGRKLGAVISAPI